MRLLICCPVRDTVYPALCGVPVSLCGCPAVVVDIGKPGRKRSLWGV